MSTVFRYEKGRLTSTEKEVVAEVPLPLIVNGREIATLISSPHDLRFLVAGFLRLQGLVEKVEDFYLLSVCNDFGVAKVQIRGELPERLKPILTSGCGTGITFTIPGVAKRMATSDSGRRFTVDAIFGMMNELARVADSYKNHGGIHSAAVGRGSIALYAEDLGRHNTIDRLAGEALLKGMDIEGMMLVTSGRVSSELIAKASMLGIPLVASRTSPTAMAVKLAEESGITLIGYVKNDRFDIYTHPEGVEVGGVEQG